jgi:hypothetical protein
VEKGVEMSQVEPRPPSSWRHLSSSKHHHQGAPSPPPSLAAPQHRPGHLTKGSSVSTLLSSGTITIIVRPARDTPRRWADNEPTTACGRFLHPTDEATTAAATYTFPESVLMAQEWPQGILPPMMVIFFEDADC